jgi:excisionase family DNA binding protein
LVETYPLYDALTVSDNLLVIKGDWVAKMQDMSLTMTLQEAADHLGAHYMTVYRYVRLGRLPARKVAGVWEVDLTDVVALQEDKENPTPARKSADWTGRLEVRLLEGDEPGAWGVVEGALASGTSPSEIYLDVLGPALVSIGDKWVDGSVSLAREHLATAVALRLIGRLGPRFARRGRAKGTVLVTTPPGERHFIPSLIVSDLLRGAGLQVIDLGADVPAESLAGIVAELDGVVAVCVGTTRPGADPAIRRSLKAVHRVDPNLPVFVGGNSITDADHAVALGADGWAKDGTGVVDLVLSQLA